MTDKWEDLLIKEVCKKIYEKEQAARKPGELTTDTERHKHNKKDKRGEEGGCPMDTMAAAFFRLGKNEDKKIDKSDFIQAVKGKCTQRTEGGDS